MKIAVTIVHLFFSTIWLGSAVFYGVLLLPRLRALDSAQGAALKRSLRAAMTPLLAVSALATIVSGIVLMIEQHASHPGPLSSSRWGVALVIGTLASLGAVAIAAWIEAMLRRDERRPAAARRAAARSGLLREEPLRLIAVALLVLALVTMAVARYS